jgi:predicted HTH transcriptional regulator
MPSNKYIKNLIEQGENQQLDFKFEISDSKKIARTFSAFANTEGGKLLIGVKDNGVITGIRTDEEYYMIDTACMFCKPEIKYTAKKWCVDGKWILEVTIPKSKNRPYYARNEDGRWLAYIRVADENLQANSILIKVWKNKNRKKGVLFRYGKKEKELLEYLGKKKSIIFPDLRKNLKLNKSEAEGILVKLIFLGIIKMEFSGKEVLYKLEESAKMV